MNFITVFIIIIVAAVLMIIQAGQTPAAVARYGLDQPQHDHEEH